MGKLSNIERLLGMADNPEEKQNKENVVIDLKD